MANLVDSSGEAVFTYENLWYKISLADGSELGLGEDSDEAGNGRAYVKVVPAGRGLTFRYQRTDGGATGGYGWPQGDKGWLRGLQVLTNGAEVVKNMSMSAQKVSRLSLYDVGGSYGFRAQQLPNNRVALYAYDRNGKMVGLRVTPDGSQIIAHDSKYAVPLECAFVRTGSVTTGFF